MAEHVTTPTTAASATAGRRPAGTFWQATAASGVAVVAVGEEKAAMAERALAGPFPPRDVPAQLARHGTWFLDPRAAALVAPRLGAR